MHPSHLTAFVDGFLTIGTTMQARGASIWDILLAMSETGRASMGTVGADAIICRVRAARDRQRAGLDHGPALDAAAMVKEMITAAMTGEAPPWA